MSRLDSWQPGGYAVARGHGGSFDEGEMTMRRQQQQESLQVGDVERFESMRRSVTRAVKALPPQARALFPIIHDLCNAGDGLSPDWWANDIFSDLMGDAGAVKGVRKDPAWRTLVDAYDLAGRLIANL